MDSNDNSKFHSLNEDKHLPEISVVTEAEFDNDGGNREGHFKITAKELTGLMNKYKERGDKFNDLKYFEESGGISELLNALETDPIQGISSVQDREQQFGTNKIFQKPLPKFMDFVIEALGDKMIIILIISSIIEIAISLFNIFVNNEKGNLDYIDGVSIIIAVLIVVSVGSITNYKKEMKFHNLNDIQNQSTTYTAYRNGQPMELISDDLLVGDLIDVKYGDILPADLLLVEGNGIKIDESSLTGESDAVKKKKYEECMIEVKKGSRKPASNLLLSGTNVIEGTGKAIVIAIGEYSQKGIIRLTIENAQEDNQTPLEAKLNKIADLIGYFGLGSAGVTFIALGIQLVVEYISVKETNPLTFTQIINKFLRILILCVSIIAVAIPEGLPLAVTLSLAFSIKKLMDKNNLVRKMHACETMGGANYICTDKTGTLTKNKMQICKMITFNNTFDFVLNKTLKNVGTVKNSRADKSAGKLIRENHGKMFENEEYWNTLKTAIALNVDVTIIPLSKPDLNGDRESTDTKSKTDKAFIDFLYRYKSPISVEKKIYMKNPENYKVYPFDSTRKRMTTIIKSDKFPTGYRLFTKGGAENAIFISSKYISKETGKVQELSEKDKRYINKEIDLMNKKSMRSLYVCYKDLTEKEYKNADKTDEKGLYIDQKDLTFICVFGIKDSLRDNVKESVIKCHEASVKVIMVTGDNIVTATAIGKECNILGKDVDIDNLRDIDIESNPNELEDPDKRFDHVKTLLNNAPKAITGNSFYTCIEGIFCETCNLDTEDCKCPKTDAEAEELAKKYNEPKREIKKDSVRNMENFKILTDNLLIMARSQPIHKYALVLGLRQLGNVVAVTGDGTNDAPALSKSDVGFAMIDGTDIAKEASDIVILDNNFSSLVVAIIYGRSIYENIRKFLQFQLSVNFCACILVFICSCVGNETPLTSVQMLWVNLIMDSLGSLALATEPPYDSLLKRKPTKRTESIINGSMWKHIILQAFFQILLLISLYLYLPKFLKENKENILSSHNDIYNCFLHLPNNVNYKNNKDMILYGTESAWSNNIIIQDMEDKTYEKYNCTLFLSANKDKNSTTLFDAFDKYTSYYGSTTHMTFIFNTFVFYTLFNQINCRVIDESYNICTRITNAGLFIIVTGCEMLLQIILVQFGGSVFKCVKGGLSLNQWMWSILLSLTTFVFSPIIKMIPMQFCINNCIEDSEEMSDEEILKEKLNEKSQRKSRLSALNINYRPVKNKDDEDEEKDKDTTSENDITTSSQEKLISSPEKEDSLNLHNNIDNSGNIDNSTNIENMPEN